MDHYLKLLNLNTLFFEKIKQLQYDDTYMNYLIDYKLTSYQYNNFILNTHGLFTILKHTMISGSSIYNMLKNNFKDIVLHVYFKSFDIINELLLFFNNYIVEKSSSKTVILYNNIHLIFHTKKIYKNQLELIMTKPINKYNYCVVRDIIYYSPISYYLLNNDIDTMKYTIENHDVILSIIDHCNLPLEKLTIMYKHNINYLYVSLLILNKFDYFDKFIDKLNDNFFSSNYIIFDMIKTGKIDFFKILNSYEQKSKKIFNLNILNKSGLTPPEYCLYRKSELINNQHIPINIKEQLIYRYKEIFSYLMYNRKSHYTRNIVFFDYLTKSSFIKTCEIYKPIYDEINLYSNKYTLSNINNNIKQLNSVYLTICYKILNSNDSFISIDDILDFIIFNKKYIDIHSMLLICKSNNSQLILSVLLTHKIIDINDLTTLLIFIDLKYFNMISKYKDIIIKYAKEIILHSIDTLNIEALYFINDIDHDLLAMRLYNDNTILHYIVTIKYSHDNDLCKQIGIIKDMINVFHPELLNEQNNNLETPLFICERPEIFKTILSLNPNLNILNKNGNSIMHKLIDTNNINYIKLLINHNKQCLILKNNTGDIPIIYALKNKNFSIALSLLNYSYDDKIKKNITTYLSLYNINLRNIKTSKEDDIIKIVNNISSQFD